MNKSKPFVFKDDTCTVRCEWDDESKCWVATLTDEDGNESMGSFAGVADTPEEALAHLVVCWYYNPLSESHWEEEK